MSAPATAAGQPAGKVRLAWPDAARGFCMVVVVLWHSTLWISGDIAKGQHGFWFHLWVFLSPLMMPLFFFISGYFVAGALPRPLNQTRNRTVGMYYLYAVWTAIFIARLLLPQARGGLDFPGPGQLLLALLLPTSYWFLWCLAVYFVLGHLMLRVSGERAWMWLVPLSLLSIFSRSTDQWSHGLVDKPLDAAKVAMALGCFVWFYGGALSRPVWARLMERASWSKVLASAAVYTAIYFAAKALIPDASVPFQEFPMTVVALFTVSQLLALLPMDNAVARWFRGVGGDTLGIYIFHIFMISIISALCSMTGADQLMRAHLGLTNWLVPPLMAAVMVTLSRLITRLVLASPLAFLLDPPAPLVAPQPKVTPRRARN